jgi:cell pole-organizing protein PopZ
MEEILASIRRIIADDETKSSAPEKPALATVKPAEPMAAAKAAPVPSRSAAAAETVAPKPVSANAAANNQDDIDALLAGFDSPATGVEAPAAAMDDDVFDLTDEMALPDMPQASLQNQTSFQSVEPESDLEFSEVAMASEHRGRTVPERQMAPDRADIENLAAQQMLSRSTVSAVESAFNSLANTVLSNNARTLEDLVREMLRPMLKSWLDDNLPGLVERIVKAEIERVSRGR